MQIDTSALLYILYVKSENKKENFLSILFIGFP